MKYLIEKHQQKDKGRGIILPTLEEMERDAIPTIFGGTLINNFNNNNLQN